jgi:putative membrane protein
MTLLTDSQKQQVASAVAEVEKTTDAELVTVLARRADNYLYIPTLWAAFIALITPLLLEISPFWLAWHEVMLAQWLVFFVFLLLFRIPPLLVRLIPRSVRYRRASNLAYRQFLENGLHHTQGETGVLIFISEAEQYVEILADRGISQHVSDEQWQGIVDALIARIKQKKTLEGILECIHAAGALLQKYAPATHARNELPDHLVVLD